MVDRPELHVTLTPALAEVIQQAVETGEYASQDDVVSEALLEWRLRRALDPTERVALCRLWVALCRLWDEGLASGSGRFRSMDEIRGEALRRWTEEQVRRQAEG
jgi:antitoxin ParD1/3/4